MTRPICARAGCGTPVGPQATGRPARFCSNACRQGAFRDRARARAAAAAAPPPHRSGQPVAWNAARQTMADQLRATRQDRMSRDASRLRAALKFADPAQDGPALREELRLLRAEIEERDGEWPDS